MKNNIIKDFNLIIEFLAKRDIASLTKESLFKTYGIEQVDLLIVAGNCIPYIAEEAAKAYKNGLTKKLMFTGGEGHTTEILRYNIKNKYPHLITKNKTESDIFADLLEQVYDIKRTDLIIENTSTHSGENASNSLKTIQMINYIPKYVLLMQDPSLQRRLDASFKKEWINLDVTFINYAITIPYLKEINKKIEFGCDDFWGRWQIEHFLSLVLGEIPRLNDTKEGYGPKGKNFIIHVDIPFSVLNAFKNLKLNFKELIRS